MDGSRTPKIRPRDPRDPSRSVGDPPTIRRDPSQLSLPIRAFLSIREERGSGTDGGPRKLTKKFTANTCRQCQHITIAGQWVGLRVDLEPETLTDLDEYRAVAADVRTWDLYPDRTAEPRSVAHIAAPTSRGTRHARHTCGTTYGSQPLPPTRPTYVMPDEPAF